jgi:hypothetical protein
MQSVAALHFDFPAAHGGTLFRSLPLSAREHRQNVEFHGRCMASGGSGRRFGLHECMYDHSRLSTVTYSVIQGNEVDESLTNLHIESNRDCNATEESSPVLPPRPFPRPHSMQHDYGLEDSALDGALQRPPTKDISLQGFLCDDCETTGPDRYHCDICQFNYCQRCWDKVLLHRREPSKGQVRHEKTDLELARKIEASIRPDRSATEDFELHMDDRAALWFGFSRTDAGPRFIDNERYEVLLSDYSPAQRAELHPSLVSFIGQTGNIFLLNRKDRRPLTRQEEPAKVALLTCLSP